MPLLSSLLIIESLASAYISMYSCKNVLLQLGSAKARAGGTVFFEEYMRYLHSLRLSIIADFFIRPAKKMQKNLRM